MVEKPKSELENGAGAWARFERAVDAAVKSGPKHKTAAQAAGVDKKSRPASKGRVHKGKTKS